MSTEAPTKPKSSAKRIHPILQLPERFQQLSVQFGKEPELNHIQSAQAHPQLSADESITNTSEPATERSSAARGLATRSYTTSEPPFRLYDLVRLDPAVFWKLYHARAYNDLLLRLTYERFVPNERKGKTNYIETIHLTGTTHEPAKTNALEFWHSVEDGADNAVLALEPDPANTHDPHAIRVLTASRRKQIGWIPAKDQINQLVGRNLQLGCFNTAQLIKAENTGKNGTIGIQIAIGWTFPEEILAKYGVTPE
jgi:hypothetical protein